MRKIFAIIHYEYKLNIKRKATWGILIVTTFITLLDNFPSDKNLVRLEFLISPAYFIYRTISFDALILIFGLMFLLSNRFLIDDKNGVKILMMSSPVPKGQYIAGKIFASIVYIFTILLLFLLLNTTIYSVAVPIEIDALELGVIFLKAVIISCLPISIFIGVCSVALPVLMDLRFFYLLASVLFMLNAFYVGTAGAAPCYLITSGDLIRLIWTHPKWLSIHYDSIFANLLFLLGCSFISWFLLLFNHKFWRAK